MRPPRPTRCACSWNEPRTRAAGSRCTMTTQRRSCRSAADSMAFPSRSSLRQRGCRRCHRRRSRPGSMTSSGLFRGGSRGAVERHQTLRRTIDWSYDLLSDRRATGAGSAVGLRGGASLDDAERGGCGRHDRRVRRGRAPQRVGPSFARARRRGGRPHPLPPARNRSPVRT